MNESSTECMERMKESIKEFVDGINPDSHIGRKVIKMTYGFTRHGFLEYRADKQLNSVAGDVQ